MGWRVSRVRVFKNGSECWRRAAGAAGVRTFADIEYLGPSITLGVAISESIGLTFVSISGIDLRAAYVLPPVGLDCDHRSTTLGDLHHILLLIVDDRAIFHRHFCFYSFYSFHYNCYACSIKRICFRTPQFANLTTQS